jgi:hypothetical protein
VLGFRVGPIATRRRYQVRKARGETSLFGLHKKEKFMKYIIIAAAAATISLTGIASAQVAQQQPAIEGRAPEYGEPPNGANITTTQPSGGYAEDTLGAPTGNLQGATMGGANMNGPNRDGQPAEHQLQNGDSPEVSH